MEVIYAHSDYKIILEDKPNKNAIALLHKTLWGTNGPIFEHLDTAEKVGHLSKSLAFSIEKKGKTIGTCTVLEREITLEGKEYTTWYGRYFAIDKQYQGSIFGGLLLKHIKAHMEAISNRPTIFYAYVDQANPRSSKLLKYIGFEIIRNFETAVFSRMYPKKNKRVNKIQSEDVELVLALLKKQYAGNVFVNFDNLFFQDNYFVLKEGTEIIAGVQASVVNWKINRLPGFSGKVIIKVLPHLPFISRLFNPKNFSFVAFEAMYCKQGYEKEVFTLMESACAALKLCTGMMWMDPESELSKRIKNVGEWGIMNKMKEDLPVHVVAGFRNVTEKDRQAFYNKPTYISAFDLT